MQNIYVHFSFSPNCYFWAKYTRSKICSQHDLFARGPKFCPCGGKKGIMNDAHAAAEMLISIWPNELWAIWHFGMDLKLPSDFCQQSKAAAGLTNDLLQFSNPLKTNDDDLSKSSSKPLFVCTLATLQICEKTTPPPNFKPQTDDLLMLQNCTNLILSGVEIGTWFLQKDNKISLYSHFSNHTFVV